MAGAWRHAGGDTEPLAEGVQRTLDRLHRRLGNLCRLHGGAHGGVQDQVHAVGPVRGT